MASIADTLRRACLAVESDSSRLDVELLLAKVLGVSRSYFFTWPEKEVNPDQLAEFETLLQRRIAGEPVAHILGERGFWSLQLSVNASTLIPRPDTEILVETVLADLKDQPLTLIDVGTGTGAIGLALASERPQWQIYGVDFSFAACQLALLNARKNALPFGVWRGSWLDAVASNSIQAIVSNPPYIDPVDPHLQQGDVRFEPLSALVAGQHGLADLISIMDQAMRVLQPSGYLLLEHGYDQASAVQSLMRAKGYTNVSSVKDFGGQWRATRGYKGDASDE